MALHSLHIAEPAQEDMQGIFRYVAIDLSSPMAANDLLNDLIKAIYSLKHMPYRVPLVQNKRLSQKGYRKIAVKNYLVFFSVNENQKKVNVERILYNRRDWTTVLSE